MKKLNHFGILFILFAVCLCLMVGCKKKEVEEIPLNTVAPILFNPNLIYGTMTDQEGNVYKTIKIGEQTWMAENLRTTKFNDGTAILEVNKFNGWWITYLEEEPGYCWYECYPIYSPVYGALYNGMAVNTGKLAPVGWHIPTDKEWADLIDYLGGYEIAGPKLKEAGTTHWLQANNKVDNSSGFTALPGGTRGGDVEFSHMGEIASFWSSSTIVFNSDNTNNWICQLLNYETSMLNVSRSMGLSVRCVKDN
jgi:uncharacterized protein (TIGR02145 family)